LESEHFSSIILFQFNLPDVLGVISVILLLICSALVSGSEVALFSLKPSDFEADENKMSSREKILIKLLDKPKKLLATILIANNFINIAIVLLYSSLSHIFNPSNDLQVLGISLAFIVDIVIVTFLLLLFGEIFPKVYANRNNIKFSHLMAYPLLVLDKLLTPLSLPLRNFSNLIQSRLAKQKPNLSVDQLSHALELTRESETSSEEKKILRGIVSFGNIDAKEVMKPRIDMFALNYELSFKDIIAQIMEVGYSRIPVYKEDIDNIEGILYIKDLLPYIDKSAFKWQSLLREPYFVPENKKLDDLLNEFKEQKNHLAIVVDEYGGTSGLITLEDIIEEIVGDISDEFDDEDIIYSKIDSKTYVFEGKTSMKDFYQILKFDDEQINIFEESRGDAETIAGFLLEVTKGFPKKNQEIKFDKYRFVAEVIDDKRIKQIKVIIGS
jgi:gliding motility-associated protein GldE